MNKRNDFLDLFKLVLATGVIFVHFQFEGPLGNFLASLGTMGVIVFFLISGYSCYKNEESDNSKTILRRTKRILHLTLVAFAIYLIFTIIEQAVLGTLGEWANTYLTNPWLYVRIIFLGDFEFIHGDHLWFMVALLYGYLIMYFVEKHKLRKLVCIATPLLVLLRIVIETYTNSFGADWHISGNVIVGALPMLALGYYIHMKEKTLLKLGGEYYIALMIISYFLMYYSVNNKFYGLDISQIFKVSTATLSFLWCLSYPNIIKANIFSSFGRWGSLYIYIFHYLIGVLIKDILLANGFDDSFLYTYFSWIVVIVSFLFAAILSVGEAKLLPKLKKKRA